MKSENAFMVKDEFPDENQVLTTLKTNYSHLDFIRQFVRNTFGETIEEWKYYGQKNGWLLKKFYKKRNLFFISICDGYFKISFVFGNRAFNSIVESDISPELQTELTEAKKYAEGRGLTIKVEDTKYLTDIKNLIRIKINNG